MILLCAFKTLYFVPSQKALLTLRRTKRLPAPKHQPTHRVGRRFCRVCRPEHFASEVCPRLVVVVPFYNVVVNRSPWCGKLCSHRHEKAFERKGGDSVNRERNVRITRCFPPQDRDRCLERTRTSSPAQVAGSQCTNWGLQLAVKHVDRIFSFDLDQPAVETAAKLDQLLCLLADAPLCVHLVRGNAKGSAAVKRVENLTICI